MARYLSSYGALIPTQTSIHFYEAEDSTFLSTRQLSIKKRLTRVLNLVSGTEATDLSTPCSIFLILIFLDFEAVHLQYEKHSRMDIGDV